jgi:lytic murein transglycosylase
MRRALALLLALAATPAFAQEHPEMTPAAIAADRANFGRCIAAAGAEAARAGVPQALIDREIAGLQPEMRLIENMRSQPEFERPLWAYIAHMVNDARVAEGRRQLQRHQALLQRIEAQTGVDRYTLVALWGVETNFGAAMGSTPILRSVGTLACVGRRKEFFRGEFVAALRILARNDIAPPDLVGSWAGAFGHTQFMPSTFFNHAVDGDGDGRRNLVRSLPDALASTANMLRRDGWERGKTWGYEVVLPQGFDFRLAGGDRRMTVADWRARGVRRAGGRDFPRDDDMANLVVPTGARGPAFLVMANYHAIRRYNGSEAYAFALGHLADRLRGGGGFVQAWPTGTRMLTRLERMEMQRRLTELGFDTGGADGKIGQRTRDALRAFQIRAGLVPDGFPTAEMLGRLRTRTASN